MLRKKLCTCTVAILTVMSINAHAQFMTPEPGYAPAVSPPVVNLPTPLRSPTVNTTAQSNIPAGSVPDNPVSVDITRTGGETVAQDPVSAALSNLTAEEPKASSTRTSTVIDTDNAEKNEYVAGMRLVGTGKAYDGHSLTVDGHPVRLNGVEAPGRKQTCNTSSGTVWRCGEKAYERLAALVDGKKVVCIVDAPAGSGAAATCSASRASDIGRLLTAEGMVIPNRQSKDAYRQEVRSANSLKKGIWVGSFEDPTKWRIRNK